MTRLKQKRLAMGLNLRALGDKVGALAQNVQQQEQRGIRTVKVARRYALALNCRPEDILEL